MTKIKTKKAGFSLIELLFAMFFLSVIIFGVIKLQTSNLTIGNTQQNELKAHFYASQGLEIISALGYGMLAAAPCDDHLCYLEYDGDYSLSNNPEVPEVLEGIYTRQIEKINPADYTNAYHVRSTVSWEDSAGPHSVSTDRFIHQ